MFLLDTVVLSELRKKDRNPGLVQWIGDKNDNELFVSAVTIGEIERGICQQRAKDSAFAQKLTDWLAQLMLVYAERILPVTIPIARRWGQLSADLGRADADILIAASAIEHGLTVVTRNEKHFTPTGVRVVNPWERASSLPNG